MLREKLNKRSIEARKNRNYAEISAFNSMKTAITNADKENKNTPISDDEIYKVINKLISQRQDSVDSYTNAGNIEKANMELSEINVLKEFLPEQMSVDEIQKICKELMSNFISLPENARIGKTIGEFNKLYVGKADKKLIMDIVKNL